MSLDILGPASASNSVTARPTQTTTYGALRTWFKACSSLTAQDGTQVTADWLNDILAQFRTAFDNAGIVEDNGDDMLWRAIQTIGIRWGVDAGTPNALDVTFGLTISALAVPLYMAVVVGNTNGAAATITIRDGAGHNYGPLPIVDNTGQPLGAASLVKSQIALLMLLPGVTQVQLMNPAVRVLQQVANFYVNGATGNDTYDGTAAVVGGGHGPFQTIQRAVAQTQLYNMNGYDQNIFVADGSYTGPVNLPQTNGAGAVNIIGNVNVPANCQVTSTGAQGSAFAQTGGNYYVTGFRLASGATGDYGFGASGGTVLLGNLQFGPCGLAHIAASNSGTQITLNAGAQITIETGANTSVGHIWLAANAGLNVPNPPGPSGYPKVTINGSVSLGTWVTANQLGQVQLVYNTITGAANVTASKFNATLCGIIQTLGGGTSYYPGNTAGATSLGGECQ